MARIRFQIKIRLYELEGRNILYLDESGFAINTSRTHGYSLKGNRCYGKHDWHAKGRINVIGVIIGFVFLTVCLFDGNINSDVFYAWLLKDLLPKTPPQSVIIMDNAPFHKRQDIEKAILSQGHTLEYLPSYSPDLNPIEHKWAQAKTIRRRLNCSVQDLFLRPELRQFMGN